MWKIFAEKKIHINVIFLPCVAGLLFLFRKKKSPVTRDSRHGPQGEWGEAQRKLVFRALAIPLRARLCLDLR